MIFQMSKFVNFYLNINKLTWWEKVMTITGIGKHTSGRERSYIIPNSQNRFYLGAHCSQWARTTFDFSSAWGFVIWKHFKLFSRLKVITFQPSKKWCWGDLIKCCLSHRKGGGRRAKNTIIYMKAKTRPSFGMW